MLIFVLIKLKFHIKKGPETLMAAVNSNARTVNCNRFRAVGTFLKTLGIYYRH